ncbi:S-adenosyl-L-methionine-dependent methyltransferase [Cladochytrium replicatum]|nr:S-adenosyl-L-methionine-dependent methyltransferase [Cladochytrium replicatum]
MAAEPAASNSAKEDNIVNGHIRMDQIEVDFLAVVNWQSAVSSRSASEAYVLENDDMQNVRLNLQHHLVRQKYDGVNYKGIPLDHLELGASVLDVGCGSGIWLAEMQRDFPEGEYVGLDIQPTEWARAFQQLSGDKIKLVEGDVLRRLPFDDETFDYVHQQNMFTSIPAARWPEIISEFFRVLKPGGYIDLVELEIAHFPNDPPTERSGNFINVVKTIFAARGVNCYLGRELQGLVESSRLFENVECFEKLCALGWTPPGEPEEIGRLWAWDYHRILDGLEGLFSMALSKTHEEWKELTEGVILDFAKTNAALSIYRVVARKRL